MYLQLAAVLAGFVAVETTEPCVTPNNEKADCVNLNSCPILLQALATNQTSAVEFVHNSTCGFTGSNPKVCCGSSAKFMAVSLEPRVNVSALSDRSYCGLQHADDYPHTENGTGINEIPWSAILLYDTGTETKKPLCSGSLINNRYVLTAAHCVNHTVYRNLRLVAVRLGEYNFKNKTDCTENARLVECSEPPKDFAIEETIVHSEFIWRASVNDIALLRLDRGVQYSDYIRPICLPIPGTKFARKGDILTLSGWGQTSTHAPTETKKKILTELITHEECDIPFNKTKFVVTQNQICTRELDTNTAFSCNGDRGEPLMFQVKNQWHQEGILSFRHGCRDGYPEVHTRVTSYLNWIAEHIRV